ncbi:MAG: hypothetical protein ACI97N_000458 [Cognaticolwellia sp.]|jgi:hypothetical protein
MKKLILFLAIVLIPVFAIAQKGTFKAGLIGGFNASQIDGDDLAGYNKAGLHAGGIVAVQIAERWRPSIEVLFSQKGSRSSSDEVLIKGSYSRFSLDYVEVPVMMNYIDGGFMLNAGLSFSRLVRITDLTIDEVPSIDEEGDNFRKNSVNMLAGIGYFINDNLGFELRYSYAPFSIVDYADTGTVFREPYILKSLTIRTVYLF